MSPNCSWRNELSSSQGSSYLKRVTAYRPDPQLTRALSEFPTPSNLSELRGFVGLVNQVASFVDDVAGLLSPLRPLLSPRHEFLWEETH